MSDLINRNYGDFDKKNEFSKVKIPKFATGGICDDAIFPKLDVFSQIDEIVKDIAKQKDNAIAMEFTKCIGELLKKNGVTPKMTEYTRNFETDKTFETRYGVSIDELDFSEHDKVFEDEIAELKAKIAIKDMDYKTVSELLGKYQQENEALKKRVIELENFSCQAEQETESLVEKLKQRIAELEQSRSGWIDKAVEWQQKCEKLESKEVEKPTKCTTVIIAKEINGQEYVRLDDFMSVVNDFQAKIGT